MKWIEQLAEEHDRITRRYFLQLSAGGLVALSTSSLFAEADASRQLLSQRIAELEYLTRDEDFGYYGRGDPPPHELSLEKRRQVGLTRDTWQLEVLPDKETNAQVARPLSKAQGTAFDWDQLMHLAEKATVRFFSVMSCTNDPTPCGMGLWEGVPLREVVWLARPQANVRRIFYYGYHHDDPQQRFQSSLPIGRVLEDPPGKHPVILCTKLNNRWLSSKRGGPVRILVPDAYGNQSVKWLQRVILTNSYQANDTYALWNNDTVSHIKTCARFLHVPAKVKAGQPVPITGLAQVGISGLSKVQYWLHRAEQTLPEDDPYFTQAPWQDADILPPPDDWAGGLPAGKLPPVPRQIDKQTGRPHVWPIPNTIAHWAALLAAQRPGQYVLRCRTIDANGIAQPLPRPFPKSGHNAILQLPILAE